MVGLFELVVSFEPDGSLDLVGPFEPVCSSAMVG